MYFLYISSISLFAASPFISSLNFPRQYLFFPIFSLQNSFDHHRLPSTIEVQMPIAISEEFEGWFEVAQRDKTRIKYLY